MFIKDDLKAVGVLVSVISIMIGAELAGAIFMRVAYGDRMELGASPFAVIALVVALLRIRSALAKQSAEIANLRDAIARHGG